MVSSQVLKILKAGRATRSRSAFSCQVTFRVFGKDFRILQDEAFRMVQDTPAKVKDSQFK
jgi:hypothetical protein